MESKILGLYGGTFDPPHKAHISLAKAFLKAFPKASLIVMPCRIPPHKTRDKKGADGKSRLEMARIAFENFGEVSSYELEKEGTSYTYLTVMHLQSLYPHRKICLIMGQDNLEIIEKWREYEYLLSHCAFAVSVRGGEAISPVIEELREKYCADITLLPMEREDVSSTQIREALRNGKSAKSLVTKEVYEYIKREGLYL